jgi:hypothetical protein
MISFNEVMDSIVDGARWGVFLDDTGLQPVDEKHPDRKTWVAVVVQPGSRPMFETLYIARDWAREKYGADRLHFTDVYGQRGAFESVPWNVRRNLMREFVALVCDHELEILAAQFEPHTLALIRERVRDVTRTNLRHTRLLDDPSAAGHGRVIDAAVRYVRAIDPDALIAAFSDRRTADDEGKGIALGTADRSIYEGRLDPCAVLYCRSEHYPALQLADFAAWSFGRLEMMASPSWMFKSHREVELLEVLSPLRERTQVLSPYASDRFRFRPFRPGL